MEAPRLPDRERPPRARIEARGARELASSPKRGERVTALQRGVLAFAVLAIDMALLAGCMTTEAQDQAPAPATAQYSTDSIPMLDDATIQLQPVQYVGTLVVSANNVAITGSGVDATVIVGDVVITGDNCVLAALTVTGDVTVQGINADLDGAQIDGGVSYEGPNYASPPPFAAVGVFPPGGAFAGHAHFRPQPRPGGSFAARPRLAEPVQRGAQPEWRDRPLPPQGPPPRVGPAHEAPPQRVQAPRFQAPQRRSPPQPMRRN